MGNPLHHLERQQFLPVSLDEAWEFFCDPRNLKAITPPDMLFEITSGDPRRMHPGQIITYKLCPMWNIPISWVTEITHVAENQLFVDEQRFGPYRLWHHQHHFEAVDNGVMMTDIVHYKLRFEPFGLVALPIVNNRVDFIFNYRFEAIQKRFPTSG